MFFPSNSLSNGVSDTFFSFLFDLHLSFFSLFYKLTQKIASNVHVDSDIDVAPYCSPCCSLLFPFSMFSFLVFFVNNGLLHVLNRSLWTSNQQLCHINQHNTGAQSTIDRNTELPIVVHSYNHSSSHQLQTAFQPLIDTNTSKYSVCIFKLLELYIFHGEHDAQIVLDRLGYTNKNFNSHCPFQPDDINILIASHEIKMQH